jgi:tetratricopeptide (TPR) repeat protein
MVGATDRPSSVVQGEQAPPEEAQLVLNSSPPQTRPPGAQIPLSARPPSLAGDDQLASLWVHGLRLEEELAFVESSRVWEEVVQRVPQQSHTYWRIARNYLRQGQMMPEGQIEEQAKYYALTEEWSDRGLKVDARCGECYLYKFAGLGRRIFLGNIVAAARRASELAELLDRSIALQPQYRDNEWNSELGNLYYAAAAFYRVLPEWRWLKWVIGVRGDKQRALEYSRKANEISYGRVDYHLALGASLLCVGSDKKKKELVDEGLMLLNGVQNLPIRMETDERDRVIAQALAAQPERACGYTHHDWIDVDKELAGS